MNITETAEYAEALIMDCQASGCLNFDGHKQTAKERKLIDDAKKTADQLGSLLQSCKDEEAPQLLSSYDMLYRIGFQAIPPQGFIADQQNRIFNAWKNGNHEIAESVIVKMLQSKVLSSRQTTPTDEVEAYGRLLNEWVETLRINGYFPDATTFENYQRLAVLMPTRLNIDNEEALKTNWYNRNKIEDYTTASTKILEAYRRFLFTLPPHIKSFEEIITEDTALLTALSSRPTLSPYQQQAYQSMIEYNASLL